MTVNRKIFMCCMQMGLVLGICLSNLYGVDCENFFYQPKLPPVIGIIQFKRNNGKIHMEIIDDRLVHVTPEKLSLKIPIWKLRNIRTIDIWFNTDRVLQDRSLSEREVRYISHDMPEDLYIK